LMVVDTNLYVGGAFTVVTNLLNGVPVATNGARRFAVLNYTNGQIRSLGGLNGDPQFPDTVLWFQTNLVNGTNVLYVGHGAGALVTNGYYTNLQGQTPAFTNVTVTTNNAGIAALDRSNLQPLLGFSAEFSSNVRSMILTPDNLSIYVGGDFSSGTNGAIAVTGNPFVNIGTNNRIFAMSTNGNISANWKPQANGVVLAVSLDTNNVTGTNLYIGGQFTQITNTPAGAVSNRFRAAVLSTNTAVVWSLRSWVAGARPS